jgi:hypothetical protein
MSKVTLEIKYNGMSLSEWIKNIDKVNCENMTKHNDGTITLKEYCKEKCNNYQLCKSLRGYFNRKKEEIEQKIRRQEAQQRYEYNQYSQLFEFTFNPDKYPIIVNVFKTTKEEVEMYMAMDNLFNGDIPEYKSVSDIMRWKRARNKRIAIERGITYRKRTSWIKSLINEEYWGCPYCACKTGSLWNIKTDKPVKDDRVDPNNSSIQIKCEGCRHLYDEPILYKRQKYTKQQLEKLLEEVGIHYDNLEYYAQDEEALKRLQKKLESRKKVKVLKF